jgi:hypothetical protein
MTAGLLIRPRSLTARRCEFITDITRREFVIADATLAGLVAAGCGSNGADPDPANSGDGVCCI